MTEILEIQSQICLNVSRMMQGIIGAISRGGLGGGSLPKVSTPFIPGYEPNRVILIASNRLKIAEQEAYG